MYKQLEVIDNREDFGYYLNAHGLVGEGVEVGVLTGNYSSQLLKTWHGSILHCVDPWTDMRGDLKYKDSNNSSQKVQDSNYYETIKNLSPYNGRYRIHRKLSVEAASTFKDCSIDFVYIDARHYYEAVIEDLNTWAPKIKNGGILSGHDYLNGVINIDGVDGHFEVKKAVDEWAKINNKIVVCSREELWKSWIIHI